MLNSFLGHRRRHTHRSHCACRAGLEAVIAIGIVLKLLLGDMKNLDAIGGVMGVIHSCVVPIAYGLINHRLRHFMLSMLTCGIAGPHSIPVHDALEHDLHLQQHELHVHLYREPHSRTRTCWGSAVLSPGDHARQPSHAVSPQCLVALSSLVHPPSTMPRMIAAAAGCVFALLACAISGAVAMPVINDDTVPTLNWSTNNRH